MRRTLIAVLLAGLTVTPAALAKGPHAVLHTSGERVEAGRPWPVKIEMFEYAPALRPVLIATRGERRVSTETRLARRGDLRTIYRATLVLPADGEWQLKLDDGRSGFRFMPVQVGGPARSFRSDTAFPGMMGRPTPLPPDEFVVAKQAAVADGGSGWVALPLAAAALAGAGVLAGRRRLAAPRRAQAQGPRG